MALGFLINGVSVFVGAILGLLLKKILKKEYCESVIKVIGISSIIIGVLGVVQNTYVLEENEIKFEGTLLLIISLAVGTFLGELLKIDTHLNDFSKKIEVKLNKGGLSEGFLASSMIYCVGAMTIIGSLNDVLGDHQMIYLKSLLDFVTSIVLASTLGFGVLLSCVSVFVIQGLLTLLFFLLKSSVDIESMNQLIRYLGMIGYAIVMAIGINFLLPEERKIKVANSLPALLIPIIYYVVTLCID